MYYSYPQIVLQEVPGEISLALSISGCDIHCKGCHSQETWNPFFGKELTEKELEFLIKKHKHISCILFYGGEWDIKNLEKFIKLAKNKDLKIALYTGKELSYFDNDFLSLLDYIKVGPYIENLGALKSPSTNQKMYELKNGKIIREIVFF